MNLIRARNLCRDLNETLIEAPATLRLDQLHDFLKTRKYYASLLADLGYFVEAITRAPVLKKTGDKAGNTPEISARSTESRHYFKRIPEFIRLISMLSNRYKYNEHIQVFKDCCATLGLFGMRSWDDLKQGHLPLSPHTDPDIAYFELEKMIREKCLSISILTAVSKRRHEANERFKDYARCIDASFERHSRLIFIRLDLSYKKQCASDAATAQRAISDLGRFLNNRRHNKIFLGWVNYVAKLEYGVLKGVHWHLLIWFDGRERDGAGHIQLAKDLGEEWEKLTGDGKYWNCNARTEHYRLIDTLGVGLIRYDDIKLRHDLINHVLFYLTKISQLLRPAFGEGFKNIRRGQNPKPPPGEKRGPKRTKLDLHSYVPL